MEINKLVDLNNLRTAPKLSNSQEKKLLEELEANIFNADWITIGIMAPSDSRAIEALQSISKKYDSIKFGNLDSLHADGCVFLKANQKTGNVFVRSENGLGEGILITCQYDEDAKESIACVSQVAIIPIVIQSALKIYASSSSDSFFT